jgi:hypothetical protein
MLLSIFDTHLGMQCMEGIHELREFLVPPLMQCGPSRVFFIIVSNRVIFFLNDIHKIFPIQPQTFHSPMWNFSHSRSPTRILHGGQP